ncbi:hypothetical protein NBH19_03870 [Rhizobium sp. S95]|uniref:Uncharacterized protein n=1 Tax=Ciceribacter sichuanensis TaxID=2949647 RepID=A0AAJ1F696_9HYPH|nr:MULTISPECIES: hypothetical protein [unclassified Ciceribacter]MCM2395221.1 hypothetical protein [Ciceribacter sp. S95]MCO5955643.1 hypothetical protein [Ciceribacter sp. S101]
MPSTGRMIGWAAGALFLGISFIIVTSGPIAPSPDQHSPDPSRQGPKSIATPLPAPVTPGGEPHHRWTFPSWEGQGARQDFFKIMTGQKEAGPQTSNAVRKTASPECQKSCIPSLPLRGRKPILQPVVDIDVNSTYGFI